MKRQNTKFKDNMKYITIDNKRYKVIKEYDENGKHYIRYKDNNIEKDVLNKLYLDIASRELRVQKNLVERMTHHQVNWFNPLTYVSILCMTFVCFFISGFSGVIGYYKESLNSFRDEVCMIHSNRVKFED